MSMSHSATYSESFQKACLACARRFAEQADRVERHFLEKDFEAIRSVAHTLEGTAGSFGFGDVHSAARVVRDAKSTEDLVQAVKSLTKALREWESSDGD